MSSASRPRVPPYFDYLIDAFRRGEGGRWVHLGHWDRPPGPAASAGDAEFLRAQQRLDDRLLQMASVRDGDVVVDVGCGFGGTLARLNETRREVSLVGVNVDHRQLAICRGIEACRSNRLGWWMADACALPLLSERVDRVLSVEAMFHFSSRRRFFAEAARVLRPGGVMVMTDIVLTRPPADTPTPAFPLQPALQNGFGPWPDPWGNDADHTELGRAVGLACEELRDATVNTRPSHRFTAPVDLDIGNDPGDPARRAALALAWLHEEGLLRYLYGRFRKRDVREAGERPRDGADD